MPFKIGDYVRTAKTPKGRFHPWPLIGDGQKGIVTKIEDAGAGGMIYVSFTVTLPYFAPELDPEACDGALTGQPDAGHDPDAADAGGE